MKIAVIGATGAVGREIMSDLEESQIENCEVFPFASPRSEGEILSFRQKAVAVKAFNLADVRKCDYVLMSAGGTFSKENSPKICADQGPIVIDNSSAWRMDKEIPLIVPEVNGDVLKNSRPGIIANPNCAMIQLAVCLKPLQDVFGLEMVNVTTYQSVSGTGQKGIKELSTQLETHMKFGEIKPTVYDHPIAFNVIPYIGPLYPNGYCEEEWKIVEELRKVLRIPSLAVLPTTVRVPVFNCHCESVSVLLKKSVKIEEVRELFGQSEALEYISDDRKFEFPTPRSIAGKKNVSVCRLRLLNGESSGKWLQFWNVADNLKKGAATNAVQILEYLLGQ